MSDDDFMQDSEEEYDFEYEDDDEEESGDIDIENKYYNAKQLKSTDPDDAIAEFLAVPGLEKEKGEWGFKGLKQATKLEFKLGRYDRAIEHYTELLTYVKSAVTRNYSEKSINNMLDYIEKGAAANDAEAVRCMERFYSQTMTTFQSTNNERLWLKTNIKQAKLLLDRGDYNQVGRKLRELHRACQRPDGTDDPSKGTYSLEIYALEIQMHAATRNNKQLKRLYERALKVRSAVPHPKIMGIIRECGGKMHMSEENWAEAQKDFFESFRNYDEAGSLQRITVLKYLLLTTMLKRSDINPFDSQETKPYRNDPRVAAMTELVDAFLRDDMMAYEHVLGTNSDLLADPFIAENIDEVTRTMRTKSVLRLVRPYTRVSLARIAQQLRIDVGEVRDIVGFLIIDDRIKGRIDQRTDVLEMGPDVVDNLDAAADDAAAAAAAAVANGDAGTPSAGGHPSAAGGAQADGASKAAAKAAAAAGGDEEDGDGSAGRGASSSTGDGGRNAAMHEVAGAVRELVEALFRDGDGFRPLETVHHGGQSSGQGGGQGGTSRANSLGMSGAGQGSSGSSALDAMLLEAAATGTTFDVDALRWGAGAARRRGGGAGGGAGRGVGFGHSSSSMAGMLG